MTDGTQGNDSEARKKAAIKEWEAKWEAMDFSWDGLADAGWDLGDDASEAQKLKRWRAPADFPGDGAVHGEGVDAWKEATLQDYWRWSIGIASDNPARLLSDAELLAMRLLERDANGKLWHIVHFLGIDQPNGILEEALLARLQQSDSTCLDAFGVPETADRRIQLTGTKIYNISSIFKSQECISVNCHHTKFETNNTIAKSINKYSSFKNSIIISEEIFKETKFLENILFYKSIFTKKVNFNNSIFKDSIFFYKSKFYNGIVFSAATSGNDIVFQDSCFYESAIFSGTKFGKNSNFKNISFQGTASFHECTFDDRASFNGTKFCKRLNFEGATFKGAAFFKKCVLPKTFEDGWNAFRATRFYELVSFDDVDISCFAAFHEARFFKGVILSQPGERRAQELWNKALKTAKTATKGKDRLLKECYFAALEGGCRVLKQEMEKIADRSREQRYFRYELIARRHRPDINATERTVSRIYGALSNYGNSIGRPLLSLLASILFMMLIYGLVSLTSVAGIPFISDIAHLAFQNILRPGAVWGADTGAPGSLLAQLSGGTGWGLLGLRLLSTLHTLFAAIMVFLAGVAIRRKFRIG